MHPGRFPGFIGINANQPGVGNRTPKELGVKHPRKGDIRRVDGIAGGFVVRVDAGCGVADHA